MNTIFSSPLRIMSRGLGRPSWILNTISQGTPFSVRVLAVPAVCNKKKHRILSDTSACALCHIVGLWRPSWILNTISQGTLFSVRVLAVPAAGVCDFITQELREWASRNKDCVRRAHRSLSGSWTCQPRRARKFNTRIMSGLVIIQEDSGQLSTLSRCSHT